MLSLSEAFLAIKIKKANQALLDSQASNVPSNQGGRGSDPARTDNAPEIPRQLPSAQHIVGKEPTAGTANDSTTGNGTENPHHGRTKEKRGTVVPSGGQQPAGPETVRSAHDADTILRVPGDLVGNLRWRRFVIDKTTTEEKNAIYNYCKTDPIFFVNCFLWAYDPRKDHDKVEPFILWTYQESALLEIIEHIIEGKDLVIEKSRDMGASWLCLIAFTYLWLFRPHCAFICISKDAEAVDKYGSPGSLFSKIDFMLDMMPIWMLPGGYNAEDDRCRKRMTFMNPENKSSINGFAPTGNSMVGDRATAVFLDEFSLIEEANSILSRTSNVTRCRIFNGTHRGLGNAFFRICNTEESKMDKIIMHWTDHPIQSRGLYYSDKESGRVEILDKNYQYDPEFEFNKTGFPEGGLRPGVRSPYYDSECRRKMDAEEIARELDIDPVRSSSQFFEPMVIFDLVKRYAREPDWIGRLDYDATAGIPRQLERDENGDLKLWMPNIVARPPAAVYAVGIDVSQGVGSTPSTITILNCETGDKVGEWANACLRPEEFGAYAVALCRLFHGYTGDPAQMAWEYHGPGSAFGRAVIELGYYFYYRNETDGTFMRTATDKPGFDSRGHNKENLLTEYRAALKHRLFLNYSELALKECLLYSRGTANKIINARQATVKTRGGAQQTHGDRTIADALAWRMCRYLGFGENPELVRKEKVITVAPINNTMRQRMMQHDRSTVSSWRGVRRK